MTSYWLKDIFQNSLFPKYAAFDHFEKSEFQNRKKIKDFLFVQFSKQYQFFISPYPEKLVKKYHPKLPFLCPLNGYKRKTYM